MTYDEAIRNAELAEMAYRVATVASHDAAIVAIDAYSAWMQAERVRDAEQIRFFANDRIEAHRLDNR